MIVESMQFSGDCSGCGKHSEVPIGAVNILPDRDAEPRDIGEWLCLRCALRLAKRLLKARRDCQEKMAAGLVYQNDGWQPVTPSKGGSSGP